MRYELLGRRPAVQMALLWGALAVVIIFLLAAIGFRLWILLLVPGFAALLHLNNEITFRLRNYLILHENHLDLRQEQWGQRLRSDRVRIPYSDVLRLRVINDTEVEVVYARQRLTGDPDRDMEALVFRPRNPHVVAIDLQARVERALAAYPV